MSELEIVTCRPGAGEYAWTFGGAAPVMRIKAPCVLDVYTEDCFAGRVQSADDLVSRLNITGLNPQTGPFFVEGAEPGDTQAVESPLANVCDTNYTSIAKMPKRYLPGRAYDGKHAQLRELAAGL